MNIDNERVMYCPPYEKAQQIHTTLMKTEVREMCFSKTSNEVYIEDLAC